MFQGVCDVCGGTGAVFLERRVGKSRQVCPACADADLEEELKEDQVNQPSHYTWHPSGIECEVIAGAFPFFRGNIIKYVWRAGKKEGSSGLQDLKKAKRYIELEIARLEEEGSNG